MQMTAVDFVSRFRLFSASLPAANKQQSEMHASLGHASITTMMMSIPIPAILTLTEQSTVLHNGKV
jgi:cytochrome b561